MAVRARAWTVVANLAAQRGRVDGATLKQLNARIGGGSQAERRQLRQVMTWLLREVPSFRPDVERILQTYAVELGQGRDDQGRWDDRFMTVAAALAEAGLWDVPARPVAQRARRARIRYERAGVETRAGAVAAMGVLGPGAADALAGALNDAAGRAEVAVRLAALRASATVGGAAAKARVAAALDDEIAAVRRAALLWLAQLGEGAPTEAVLARLSDTDPAVREAAAWAASRVAPQQAGERLLAVARDDASAQVRAMAVAALGGCDADGEVDRALGRVLAEASAPRARVRAAVLSRGPWAAGGGRSEPRVRVRAAVAITAREAGDACVDALLSGLQDEAAAVRAASAAGLATVRVAENRERAIASLRSAVENGLRSGESAVAAAALSSLARLNDQAFVPVMADVAEQITDHALLQYQAAAAAAALDGEAGTRALLGLFAVEDDTVRDLAAWRVARLEPVPIAALRERLGALNDETRMAAALGLGLAGLDAAGESVLARLRDRTDPELPRYEANWMVRGYYHLARLLLGDAAARDAVVGLMLNAHFPRTALFIALPATGDTSPVDVLFAEPADDGVDLDVFLCDHRMAAVLAAWFPTAPRIPCEADEGLRRWQADRLREWWAIHRHDIRWDAQQRRFDVVAP